MSDEGFTQAELEAARAILTDPSIEKVAQALAEARRGGERWVEISAAHWMRTSLDRDTHPTLPVVADMLENRSWRRPEYQSHLDLEAEAIKAAVIIGQRKGGE